MNEQSGFGRIARDILDLCELQMQLVSVDSQEAKRKAARAFVCAVISVTLAGSALTTAMVGAGFLLRDLAGWSAGASLLSVAGGMFAIVAGLLIVAMRAVQSATAAMSETKSEFTENLKWIKAVLVSPNTSPRNQMRAEDFPDRNRGPIAADHRYSTDPLFNGR